MRDGLRTLSSLALGLLLGSGCELLEKVEPPLEVDALEVSGEITTNTTWTAARCPVRVTGDVYVEGDASPVLTIEAGCEVRLAPGAGIYVSYNGKPGALAALGTAAAPVRFVAAGNAAPGSWASLYFGDSSVDARNQLRHVVVENGGGSDGASVVLAGARVTMNDVILRGSGADGVLGYEDGGFGAGSANLTVTGALGFGIHLRPAAAHSIPEDGAMLSGNAAGGVGIDGGEIASSASWGPLGVTYDVLGDIYVEGDARPVLSLEAGTELRMASSAGLYVSYNGKPGALRAEGTAAQPVVLAGRDQAEAGAWDELYFGDSSIDDQNLLEHTRLAHGSDGCVELYQASVTMKNVRVSDCAGVGIALEGENARFGAASTAIEATGHATFGVSVLAAGAGSVPATGSTYVDNGAGGVEVRGSTVEQSATWSAVLGDMVVTGDVYIEGNARPVVTIAPGAVLRFRNSAGLYISYNGDAGGLVARGTPEQPILFTAADQRAPGSWETISFHPAAIAASSVIEHATLEWGGSSGGIISVDSVRATLRKLTVRGSETCGIRLSCGQGTIEVPSDISYGSGESANQGGNLCDECSG